MLLSKAWSAWPGILEAACLSGGTLSSGQASTVVEMVREHARDPPVRNELRRALLALCTHVELLSSAQAKVLVDLVKKDGNLDLAKVSLVAPYNFRLVEESNP